ncbi:MAG: hypothetical protein JJT96_19380 [Opitutales bacterium]|nr:hypothetical protein [Opitutales bacterium]
MPTPVQTPADILRLVRDAGLDRACTRLRKPPVPSALLRELHESGERDGIRFVARYPLSPSDLLDHIANTSTDAEVAALLGSNPRTPPPVLLRLIDHPAPQVRASVALHPNLTTREMIKLLRDSETGVVCQLARNSGLRVQHQAYLVRHPEAEVRASLADNPALDPQIVRALADDPEESVRRATAGNARAQPNQLLMWADSDDAALQHGLLDRSRLDDDLLRSLALSPHPEVRERVRAAGPPEPPELLHALEQGPPEEQQAIAARPDLPRPLLRHLCRREDPAMRIVLARHPQIDSDLAEFVSQSGGESENLALLDNPARQTDWIPFLLNAPYPRLHAALVYEEDLDPAHLHLLVNQRLCAETTLQLAAAQRPFPELRADLASIIARHPWPGLRFLAATSRQLPLALLRELAADAVPRVAQAARENANFDAHRTPNDEPLLYSLDERLRVWRDSIDQHLKAIAPNQPKPSEAPPTAPTFQN